MPTAPFAVPIIDVGDGDNADDTTLNNLNYQITNLRAIPERIKGNHGGCEQMIAPSRSGRAGRWSSPLSCQLRTKVEHGAGCFHEKSHCFSEKGQRGGVERKISQVGKTAVKSEPPALRCKLILFSLRAGRRPASSGGTPPPATSAPGEARPCPRHPTAGWGDLRYPFSSPLQRV